MRIFFIDIIENSFLKLPLKLRFSSHIKSHEVKLMETKAKERTAKTFF